VKQLRVHHAIIVNLRRRVRPKVVFDGSLVLGVEGVDVRHSRLATTSGPGRHLSRLTTTSTTVLCGLLEMT